MASKPHSALTSRVAQRHLESARIPPFMQRARQSIARLWMSGDEAGARDLLRQEVERHLSTGKDKTLAISFAQWFVDTAPSEMDTSDIQMMIPRTASMKRTAGEVRFVKDRGGDHNEWAWNPPGASERQIDPDYEFNAKNLEPLARTLRSGLMALGHAQSAYAVFTKIKSQRVSPDGNLGGKGYIMTIKDMRKMLMNVCEALSAVTDTIYDEVNAIHWHPQVTDSGGDPRSRPEVQEIMDDVEEIREDPEEWAEEEEEKMDSDSPDSGMPKLASVSSIQEQASKLAALYSARRKS